MMQVSHTVEELQKAGVFWGCSKAENVVFSKKNDSWTITSRAGGYTEGWVAEDKAGTKGRRFARPGKDFGFDFKHT